MKHDEKSQPSIEEVLGSLRQIRTTFEKIDAQPESPELLLKNTRSDAHVGSRRQTFGEDLALASLQNAPQCESIGGQFQTTHDYETALLPSTAAFAGDCC
jgi:hypothetical protein